MFFMSKSLKTLMKPHFLLSGGEAIKKELDALEANETWELVKLSKGKKPIGSRWVYKVKYRLDGTVERYKARLIAKGFT